jgi:outer membrane immunogenic protein
MCRWQYKADIMKILQIFAGFLLVLFASSAAYAGGDLTDYSAAPLPVRSSCGGGFSGFYAGGILGFGGLSSKTDVGPLGLKDNDKGFTIGGVSGYNWQCDGRLLGIETDISYFNSSTTTGVACPTCEGPGTLTFGSEINWYGTLRARVGLVGDENFLVFATGGLAYGGVDHSIRNNGFNNVVFSQSDSDTAIGWTAGGGVEYLLSDNWAFRADALYIDLGSQDHTYTADGGCGGTCTLRASYDDSFWVARVGLSYLFGATPTAPVPEYAPLK